MQVRREDKYRGLIPTVLTVWKVSTFLLILFFSISETTCTQGTRRTWFLWRCLPAPFPQNPFLGCWVGGIWVSLAIRADKEHVKVLYIFMKLVLRPLFRSHHNRVHYSSVRYASVFSPNFGHGRRQHPENYESILMNTSVETKATEGWLQWRVQMGLIGPPYLLCDIYINSWICGPVLSFF